MKIAGARLAGMGREGLEQGEAEPLARTIGGVMRRRPRPKKKFARRKPPATRRLGRKGGVASCAKERRPARCRNGKTMIFLRFSGLSRLCAAAGLTNMESYTRQLGKSKIKGS
jgi:hypothetical protein